MTNIFMILCGLGVFAVLFARIRSYKYKQAQTDVMAKFRKNLESGQLFASMRKVAIENKMDEGAAITMTLEHEGEQDSDEHFMPAKEGGLIPYFVPGVLYVRHGDNEVSFDITDVTKEHVVTINADGSMHYAVQAVETETSS